MAIVDAKFRFVWASCGYPGNHHDSTIFQATDLFQKIAAGKVIPNISKKVNDVEIPPMLIGDCAFPFRTWLIKPYFNAVLSEDQNILTTS